MLDSPGPRMMLWYWHGDILISVLAINIFAPLGRWR
jgi:hypothetical protein